MSMAATVMGGAGVTAPAAPVASAAATAAPVTAASAATTAAFTAAPTAPSSTAALRERDIGCAKRPSKCNPERAETCGKSQDDEVFADRTHDVFLH
jgi:hypothetical protein